MYGAIIGDIVGSVYERHSTKDKNFELFGRGCRFTDDTTMTIAVAEACLMPLGLMDINDIYGTFASCMKKWGRKYPNAGYGRRFSEWIMSDDDKPYNSYGNGSAMRVSPIGWKYCEGPMSSGDMAIMLAAVTHNHPEGMKGAAAVAAAITMAYLGETKEQIRDYIEKEYEYDLNRTCDDIRPSYKFDVSCQGSVPEAIIAFLDANNFEEAVRNAVSLGGDADTQAAIAGSIAEAYYGIPQRFINKANEYIPGEMKAVLNKFYKKYVWKRKVQEP